MLFFKTPPLFIFRPPDHLATLPPDHLTPRVKLSLLQEALEQKEVLRRAEDWQQVLLVLQIVTLLWTFGKGPFDGEVPQTSDQLTSLGIGLHKQGQVLLLPSRRPFLPLLYKPPTNILYRKIRRGGSNAAQRYKRAKFPLDASKNSKIRHFHGLRVSGVGTFFGKFWNICDPKLPFGTVWDQLGSFRTFLDQFGKFGKILPFWTKWAKMVKTVPNGPKWSQMVPNSPN